MWPGRGTSVPLSLACWPVDLDRDKWWKIDGLFNPTCTRCTSVSRGYLFEPNFNTAHMNHTIFYGLNLQMDLTLVPFDPVYTFYLYYYL